MYKVCAVFSYPNIIFFIENNRTPNLIEGISLHEEPIQIALPSFIIEIEELETLEKGFEYLSRWLIKFEQSASLIFVQPIYDWVKEKDQSLSYKELTFLLMKEPSLIEELAVLKTLVSNPYYFQHEGKGVFRIYEEEQVERNRKKLNQEMLNEYDSPSKENFGKIYREIIEKKRGSLSKEEQIFFRDTIEPLKDWIIFQNESNHKEKALFLCEYFSAFNSDFLKNKNQEYIAFKFLVTLGIFNEYDNLLLKRYFLEDLFKENYDTPPQQQLKDYDIFTQKPFKERKDLTSLFTITIDGEDTFDYDDALSLVETQAGYDVYIHISDVASRVAEESEWDTIASQRTKTLYLPDQILTMFPEDLTYNTLALKENYKVPAITYLVKLDKDLVMLDYDIFETLICVDENMSYNQVDLILENDTHSRFEFFNRLLQSSIVLQKRRIDHNKGMEFLFPQVTPRVDRSNQDIYLKVYDTLNSKATFIVKEWMIFINYLTALVCFESQVDLLFLNQEAPENGLENQERYIVKKKDMLEQLKYMKRSFLDTQSIGHYSLGLQFYTQCTSPIRRYLDLATQRQLKSLFSKKEPCYKKEDLLLLKNRIHIQQKNFQLVENETNKFFLLNFLLKYHINDIIYGIVIKVLSTKEYLVELDLTKNVVKVNSCFQVKTLSRVSVKLHTVIPRLGIGIGNMMENLN